MFVPFAVLSRRNQTMSKSDLKKCCIYQNAEQYLCIECGFVFESKTIFLHSCLWHYELNPDCNTAKEAYECYKFFKVSDVFDILLRNTFRHWPIKSFNIDDMLESGFYFTGVLDTVACIECGVELFEWADDDIPFEEHKRASPNCVLVNASSNTEEEQQAVADNKKQ
ncbi:uncharacterized protein LOC142327581 [Lycorma delicatula]|uniref:uncharacterized protein LOC142327581 n=1 Tax=Lycorma delicatula TaxID=130591 RepID=UPI003F511775